MNLLAHLRAWIARHWLIFPPVPPPSEEDWRAHYREREESARLQRRVANQIVELNQQLDQLRGRPHG